MKNKTGGFTLIELMITIAIISILAMIAYPSYQEQMRKNRRSDAIIALTNAAQKEERWFTENGRYTGTIADIGGATSPEGYYTISVTLPATAGCPDASGTNAYCYTLTAARTGVQSADKCGDFILDHTGSKRLTNNAAGITAQDCW